MPAVFQDVIRDLLANARKYTDPGKSIQSGLHESNSTLRFIVRDTGIGIPEKEIEDIITFGRRGSNAKERPTRGGGFGLTKAYYVTKKFNGRMWIESPLRGNRSTGIEIILPKREHP
jgi:signal transduction histidine kinase